uniref:Pre-rRNA-processing protein TSR2 homolog n=1 Tax=Aquila chrysaetos chrysaetos TaxID=223781 RepID=A0A663ES33_AQUCH
MAAPGLEEGGLFARGVRAVLGGWAALQLAVAHGFGGPQSPEKATWLAGALQEFFAQNAELGEEEVEEFLAEVMDNEFDTAVEDGSLRQRTAIGRALPGGRCRATIGYRRGGVREGTAGGDWPSPPVWVERSGRAGRTGGDGGGGGAAAGARAGVSGAHARATPPPPPGATRHPHGEPFPRAGNPLRAAAILAPFPRGVSGSPRVSLGGSPGPHSCP